jgi:hypothetical protein
MSAYRLLLTALFLAGCAAAGPREFPVTLEVDFGPANKPSVHETVMVAEGATPEEAAAKVLPVAKGAACCDPRETAAIGGVSIDPAANRWWVVSVNGSNRVSPYKTRLKPNDRVRWEYRQDEQ